MMNETEKIINYLKSHPRALKKLGYTMSTIFPFVDLDKGVLLENHFLRIVKKEEKVWILEQNNEITHLINPERISEIQEQVYKKRKFLDNYQELNLTLKSLVNLFNKKEEVKSSSNLIFLNETIKNNQELIEAKTYPKNKIHASQEGEELVKWLKDGVYQIASIELKTTLNHEFFYVFKKNNEIKIVVKQMCYTKDVALFEIKFEQFENFISSYNKDDKEKLIEFKAKLEKMIFDTKILEPSKPSKFKKI